MFRSNVVERRLSYFRLEADLKLGLERVKGVKEYQGK